MKYIHFTDESGAREILDSGHLHASSMINAVFAVAVGGAPVPSVQQTKLGRAKNRTIAVVFETNVLPDVAFPEEVIWHLDRIPIKDAIAVSAEEASVMLDNSLPINPSTEKLMIPVHPSVVDQKTFERTRLPENITTNKILQTIHHLENERRKKVLST